MHCPDGGTCHRYSTGCTFRSIPGVCRATAAGPGMTNPEPPLPSMVRQGINFAGAVAEHVATGMREASPEVIAERMEICHGCPSGLYRASDQRCSTCGCFVSAKAKMATESCPESHWGAA